MDNHDSSELTPEIQAYIRTLEGGSNWVERRDAANVITFIARNALHALRTASEDSDPDVSHVAKASISTLQEDFTIPLETLKTQLAGVRRTLRTDKNSSSSGSKSDPNGDASGTAMAGTSSEPTTEEINGWLVDYAAANKGQLQSKDGKFELELPLLEGRSQKVFVDSTRKDSRGSAVVLIYTVCGPATEKLYSSALRSNASLSHAAFALLGKGEDQKLILASRRRLLGLTEGALLDDILYVAKKGDKAESQLTGGGDEH